MDRATGEEDATDELVTLLLDDLGPALQWYRDEVARTLGLTPGEVLCLEVCRRHGSMSSGRLGERLGLTRSAVAKMLRRLEEAGHVARLSSPDHEQEIEVEVRPHAARDAVLDAQRRALRRSLREMVGNQALHGRKHAVAATASPGWRPSSSRAPGRWPTRPSSVGCSPSVAGPARRGPDALVGPLTTPSTSAPRP